MQRNWHGTSAIYLYHNVLMHALMSHRLDRLSILCSSLSFRYICTLSPLTQFQAVSARIKSPQPHTPTPFLFLFIFASTSLPCYFRSWICEGRVVWETDFHDRNNFHEITSSTRVLFDAISIQKFDSKLEKASYTM